MKNKMKTIVIRGKERVLTPFNERLMNAQTKEHSIFSTDGHEWIVNKNGQTRSCKRCMANEFLSQESSCIEWFRDPDAFFSTQDFERFIEQNSLKTFNENILK